MLQAVQQAEDNLHAIQCVARKAVGLSQAFHVSASGGVPQAAGAFPSQLEKTLVQYSPSGRYPPDDGSPTAVSGNRGAAMSGNQGAQTLPGAWNCFGCDGSLLGTQRW
jgi:hypothetical protein